MRVGLLPPPSPSLTTPSLPPPGLLPLTLQNSNMGPLQLAVPLALASAVVSGSPAKRNTTDAASAVNTTTCRGQSYAYTQLAGYGALSGHARDKFGDTIGGIGSAIALELSSWALSADGTTYTGMLWGLPDRGW